VDGPAAHTADRSLAAPGRSAAVAALRPSARKALENHPVVWLSSIRPDGGPHLLPLWFHWDGASILVFSKPGAQKVRNLRVDPRVMVALGEPGASFDVELIEAEAELLSGPTQKLLPHGFIRKYAAHMALAGVTPELFGEVYAQPIRIRPTRFLDWGGPGWTDRARARWRPGPLAV
jgi:PPOX class probable F420-dependent enzyme